MEATREQVLAAIERRKAEGNLEAVARLTKALQESQARTDSTQRQYERFLKGLDTRPPTIQKEPGMFENIRKGLGAGFTQTAESGLLGLATPLDEEAELKARAKIQAIADRFTPEGGDKESVLYNIASGLGSIGAVGAVTLAGGLAAGPVGAITAGTAAGISTQVGEASERARAQDVSEDVRRKAITDPRIIAAGALETLPFLKAISKFSKVDQSKLQKIFNPQDVKGLKKRAQSAVATGGVEAVQELAQNTAQNLVERGYNLDREIGEGAFESAGYGGATGFIYQLLIDLLPGRSRAPTLDRTPAPERNEAGQIVDPPRTKEEITGEAISEEDIIREQAALFDNQGQGQLFPQTELERRADALADPEGLTETDVVQDVEREEKRKRMDEPEAKAKVAKRAGQLDLFEDQELEQEIAKLEAEEQANVRKAIEKGNKLTAKEFNELTNNEQKLVQDTLYKRAENKEEVKKLQETFEQDLADVDVDVAATQQDKTADRRQQILNKVFDENKTTRNYNTMRNKFQRALQNEGLTNTTASDAEFEAIVKEVNIIRKNQQPTGEQDAQPSGRTTERGRGVGVQTDIESVGTGRRKVTKDVGAKPDKIPKAKAVEGADRDTDVDIRGEGTQQSALATPEQKEAPYKGTIKGVKAKLVDKPFGKFRKDQRTPAQSTVEMLEETRKTGYIDEVPDSQNPLNAGDRAFLSTIGTEKISAPTKNKPRNKKKNPSYISVAGTYLSGQPDPIDGILSAVDDIATKRVALTISKDDSIAPEVKAFEKRTGTRNATNAKRFLDLLLANPNVSDKTKKFINDKLAERKAQPKPISKTQQDKDARKAKVERERRKRERDAQIDILNKAQFEKAKKDFIKMRPANAKAPRTTEVIKYMRTTDKYKKFVTESDTKPTTVAKELRKRARKEQKDAEKAYERAIKKGVRDEDIVLPPETDALESVSIEEFGDITDGLNILASIKNIGKNLNETKAAEFIRNGDLKGALLAISEDTSMSKDIRTLALNMADYVGDTKVSFKKIKNTFPTVGAGSIRNFTSTVHGLFIVDKNAIQLADTATVHTLLHEVTHAATIKTLRKEGDPITKRLKRLHKLVKKQLPSEYGSTNVEEFVAEIFTNPTFRSKVAQLKVEDISAYQQFVNIINNLIERISGKRFTPLFTNQIDALNESQSLITEILAPHTVPNQKTGIMLAHMSDKQGASFLAKSMDKILSKLTGDKPMNSTDRSQFGDNAITTLTDIPSKLRQTLLGFMPSLSIGDIATKLNKGLGNLAYKLHKAMLEQRADIRQSDQDVQATAARFARWAEKQTKQVLDNFNSVVYDTTTMQIDVENETREDYKGKTVTDRRTGATRDAQEVYDEVKRNWDKLKANGGQKIYSDMRQAYKNQFEKLREVIFNDVDATSENNPDAKQAKKTIKDILTRQMFNNAELKVYFPLYREGEFKLVYYTAAPAGADIDIAHIEMFKTERAMKRRIKELENDNQVVQPKTGQPKYLSSQSGKLDVDKMKDMVPPTAFVNKILTQLTLAGVDKDVRQNIIELYIQSLPESAYAKALQRRKNTDGYIEDAMYTFNAKAYDLGRQIARLKNASKLRILRGEIDDYVTEEVENNRVKPKDKEMFDALVYELTERSDFARDPTTKFQAISQGANRIAFMYTIGFNASSALVNASQIPLFVLPYLSAEYGTANSVRSLNNARKIITASNSLRTKDGKKLGKNLKRQDLVGEEVEYAGKPSLENYFVARFDEEQNRHIFDLRDDLQFPNAEMEQMIRDMQELVQLAADRNQLDQSYLSAELNMNQSGRVKTAGDKFTHYGAWGFHNIENYNRQVTLATAYNLELERMRKEKGRTELTKEEKQQAAETALYKTQQTNGGAVTETGARVAQGDLGRVALMYKNYGIQMYYTMFKSFKTLIGSDPSLTKQDRVVALKQLIGVHLTALLFAGVQGIPLYGAIKVIANMFLDDEEEDWDTLVRKQVGEGWYKGAVSELTGVDVSKRVALGQLLFQTNRYNVDASIEENIFFYLGGPAWSTALGVKRGMEDIFVKGNLERGIESMVPTAFRNVYKGLVRYNREGALTRRGDPIYTDFSFGELAGQTLGFAPLNYTRNQEQNMISKGIERNISEKRTSLMRKYYVAARNGDWGRVEDIIEEIGKFNKRHVPTYGSKVAISGDSINKSMRRHMQESIIMEKFNGVSLSPMLRAGLEAQRKEWDDGWELF